MEGMSFREGNASSLRDATDGPRPYDRVQLSKALDKPVEKYLGIAKNRVNIKQRKTRGNTASSLEMHRFFKLKVF